ncbi:hypothetical protein OMAG_000339 [Candidatus Omnitrophus magneticus]|uniref:Uncharacterized protein n=1 Tax=Candidatus Omnitrophus magneticus TaxID=1609969 RepID=A0A0F0CWH6_9BACT|nr:hypothetical protein OMAG_000339 [Candidatus Omnitrophus magneticus]
MCKEWNDRQRKIYAGLKDFGGEAASIFKSAVIHYYDTSLPNRVIIIAHNAREIDSGLRDILSCENKKGTSKDNNGHEKSILSALDIKVPNIFTKEWLEVSKTFHVYAHHHGTWKNERKFEEFKSLWDRYEKILLNIVGWHYTVIDRLERLMKLEEISEAAIGTVLNLLEQKTYSDYFFENLNNFIWFTHLKDKKCFCPEEHIRYDNSDNVIFWNVLNYLEKISKQIDHNLQYGKELMDIIDNLVQFSLNKKRINNYRIWYSCVKILNNLPITVIKENITIDKFKKWLSVWTEPILDIGDNLLLKFLDDEFGTDYVYAESILYAVTEIRINDVSTKQEKIVCAGMPYKIWDIFNKHRKLFCERCSLDFVFEIADRLSKVLEYKQKESWTDVKINGDVYIIKVFRILADGLKEGDIKFNDNEYKCVINKFADGQLAGNDRVLDLYTVEPSENIGHFTFTAPKKDFVSEIIKNLPQNINWQSTDKLEEKILDIYKGLYSDNSQIWCSSLKDISKQRVYDTKDVLTVILRDILFIKCKSNFKEETKKILATFLSDKYQFSIFRRFVLLCIDEFWRDYNDFLEKFIDVVPCVFKQSDFEVEMYDILYNHNSDFSLALKERIRVLIENGSEYYRKEGNQKSLADWQYKWLSPLRGNPDFSDLYEKSKQKVQLKDGKPYEPERSLSFDTGWGTSHSPISAKEILQKSIEELIKYLNGFKEDDDADTDMEALSEELQVAVKDKPEHFTDKIDMFHGIKYLYIYKIFRGLKDAWNAGIEIDWQNIFNFIDKYFDGNKEIILSKIIKAQGEDRSKGGRYIWIVDTIVDLIGDGSRSDARAFESNHFNKVEKIFDFIIPLLNGEEKPDTQRDALTYTSNTTLGRVILNYLTFSLRVARATKKKHENWGKEKFERFFPIGIDGYIWLGGYLPQINYLDNSYIKEKINNFSGKDFNNFEWQMFMEGYLTVAKIDKDLYGLMRGNYIKALESGVFKDGTDERLVQHICIGYLQFGEELSKKNKNGETISLFWKMLNEVDTTDKRSRWENIVNFFWSRAEQGKLSDEFKKKILDFWEWTFNEKEFVQSKLEEDYNAFLSRLANLTILLDKIDEKNEQWLLLSAPHISKEDSFMNHSVFIKYLDKFSDEESIKRSGKIFKEVLQYTTPNFINKVEIQSIVKKLYEIGKKDQEIKLDADEICNTYGRRGIHFLRDLFNDNK